MTGLRMKSKILAVTVGAVTLLSGSGVAVAHEFEAETSLTLRRRPRGTVDPGTRVRFFGRLSSDRAACFRTEIVELVRVGTGVVGSDVTDREGDYSIRKRVRRTGSYFTRYRGSAFVDHAAGHRHVCFGSRSRTITVPVG